jgi:hypothetical protein
MKFNITWATGLIETIEKSDCTELEHVANSMFGRTLSEVEALGVKLEHFVEEVLGVEEAAPAAAETVTETNAEGEHDEGTGEVDSSAQDAG